MASPERTHHRPPLADADTAASLEQAMADLARRRVFSWPGDAAVTLHLLRSIQEEIQTRLPAAVAEARDQGYSWAEIGDLLAITRAAAWNHYGRDEARDRPASG